MVKYYGQLKKACHNAGLEFHDDDKFVRVEGVTGFTGFYLQYKSIMTNADAYTAKLEASYWESLVEPEFDWSAYELKIDEDEGKTFISQTQPDADGRYNMTWKLSDGSIHKTHHNLFES